MEFLRVDVEIGAGGCTKPKCEGVPRSTAFNGTWVGVRTYWPHGGPCQQDVCSPLRQQCDTAGRVQNLHVPRVIRLSAHRICNFDGICARLRIAEHVYVLKLKSPFLAVFIHRSNIVIDGPDGRVPDDFRNGISRDGNMKLGLGGPGPVLEVAVIVVGTHVSEEAKGRTCIQDTHRHLAIDTACWTRDHRLLVRPGINYAENCDIP